MRNKPILKYILFGIVFLIMFLIGLIVVPLIYFIRKWVRRKEVAPFWWFINNTLPENKNDRDYGDYGRFKHNIIGFYRQNALRNPTWEFRHTYLIPPKGKKSNAKGNLKFVKGSSNILQTRSGTYEINGVKCFRKSGYVKKWIFYIHYQLGFGDSRYIYKIKPKFKGKIMSKEKSSKKKKEELNVSTKNFDGDNPKTPPTKD